MRLYHGSTVVVKRPNIQKGRKATDFGRGFYTTTNFEQAKKWALLKKNREQSDRAIVSVYEVPDNILEGEFVVRHFAGATKEWLEFVVNNRKGKSTEDYELVMGPVAMISYMLLSGSMSRGLLQLMLPLRCLRRTNYSISFHSIRKESLCY